jgi:hypothetical protein
MLIIGYRGTIDWTKVKNAFKRCTDLEQEEINKIVAMVKRGQSANVPEDFVLHDELKELGIILK